MRQRSSSRSGVGWPRRIVGVHASSRSLTAHVCMPLNWCTVVSCTRAFSGVDALAAAMRSRRVSRPSPSSSTPSKARRSAASAMASFRASSTRRAYVTAGPSSPNEATAMGSRRSRSSDLASVRSDSTSRPRTKMLPGGATRAYSSAARSTAWFVRPMQTSCEPRRFGSKRCGSQSTPLWKWSVVLGPRPTSGGRRSQSSEQLARSSVASSAMDGPKRNDCVSVTVGSVAMDCASRSALVAPRQA
mmetsp:Transcript_10646/g.35312  ORF Transcript_10646/g.35312 Transcript_10646/m.35312 type:complete len:245 (-) Transcript_10646:1050-1784(-)